MWHTVYTDEHHGSYTSVHQRLREMKGQMWDMSGDEVSHHWQYVVRLWKTVNVFLGGKQNITCPGTVLMGYVHRACGSAACFFFIVVGLFL